ncbi:MAG TPA: glycosyltransferase [Chthoniobacterales bacterium]|jgi:glycosyltransferase involved in cell wall biosynthesis|nr:glycosyltransferase [Chthoniobacterales bacterium]
MADSTELISVSAVVPTRDRFLALQKTLESLAGQSTQPLEIIVIDASKDSETKLLCKRGIPGLQSQIKWAAAEVPGAAAQRNQGAALAAQSFIWFFDDDIVFEPQCVERLWYALQSDPQLGGVNAMITNQNYGKPGAISRFMFRVMNGKREPTYAGRVIGPAINLLPEDREDLPEVVPVEWLNTTCTIYRREALPDPPFRAEFTGYSLMEDLALSLEVARNWKLANARTARIVHESQPADYKSDECSRSCMELVNRHFIMTRIMGRRGLVDYAKLLLWELFSIASAGADHSRRKMLLYILRGKWRAVRQIASGGGSQAPRAKSREQGAGSKGRRA